ncbi:MAG: ribosomal L7Ae/L30e/S12e/Gadd45 family protein [Clostridia bacterium]|nr:ribosomal L7Ae/L30e/S12e/Gadd45 family protein [Clostridia bacterium]
MTNKVLALLGFASKAGKLSYGMDATVDVINRGKSKLAVIGCDVSEKSKKEIRFHSEKNNIQVIVLEDCNIETVSSAVGRKCGIISVNDSSFADGILNAMNKGGNV